MRWSGSTSLAAAVLLMIGSASHSRAQEGAAKDRARGKTASQAAAPAAGSGTAGRAAGSGTAGPAAGNATGARAEDGAEGVTIPAGWRPLAELVAGIPAPAPEAQVRVESRRGWGDPANGCFAVLQRVSAPERGFHLGRTQAVLLQAMQATGFTAGPNASELPFVGRGVQGRMRSATQPDAQDRIAVLSLACFYNGREPDRCRPMCDAMLDSLGTRR